MDKISNKTNFTEIRYDLKAEMAMRLRHIMLYYGLEQNFLFFVHNQTS